MSEDKHHYRYKGSIPKVIPPDKNRVIKARLYIGKGFGKKKGTTHALPDFLEKGVAILKSHRNLELSIWEPLSEGEKKLSLSEITKAFAIMLDVPVQDIKLEPMDKRMRGYYDSDGYIHLNEDVLYRADMLVKAITAIVHELRHAYQYKAIRDMESSVEDKKTIQAWRDNFENYLKIEDDYRGYWKQPVEADARRFSEEIVRKWRSG